MKLTLVTSQFLAGCLALLISRSIVAGDWPQILGPHRNGIAEDEQLSESWPDRPPKVVWEHPVGQGYAGVAVQDGKVVVVHRLGERTVVQALNANTGKEVWKHEWPARYGGGIDRDQGPRCVPVIEEESVIVHDVDGHLVCLDFGTGQERWRRDTRREFRFPESYFGAGSSPLVVGKSVLLNVGGRDGAGIVAFALHDGSTVWKATDEGASYSSPVLARVADQQVALFVTRLGFVGIDPAQGAERFRLTFGRRGPTVNGANPVVIEKNHVLLTAAYQVGAKLVRLEKDRVEALWRDQELLSSQYTTPIFHQGAIYGLDGREDVPPTRLVCFDPVTREIHWEQPNFGMATLIGAGEIMLAMKTNGELVVVQLTQRGYKELAQYRLLPGTTRALPALANGKLYVRNEETLKCFQLPTGSSVD